METWHILVSLGILAFLLEIFTISFFFASIGIGFFFASIANYLGLDVKYQILSFSFGIITTYFLIRPILHRYAYKGVSDLKMNGDALIGQIVEVVEDIDNTNNKGRVKIGGESWKAVSSNGDKINKGSKVEITNKESITLFVKNKK